MRVVLRADAGIARGTGHVMRCLTIGEALVARGHEVDLVGSIADVPWLRTLLARRAIVVHDVPTDSLDIGLITRLGADRVVVDSYWIDPSTISLLDLEVPVLAIVDGDTRGISASRYLDQNLGAEDRGWSSEVRGRLLAGSKFALVRTEVLEQRRASGWNLPRRPRVIAFMGGTDPFRFMTAVASSIVSRMPDIELIAVTTEGQVGSVAKVLAGIPHAHVLPPTPDLPSLFGEADLVVSAAGTSAWDVLTIGRPAVLVGVVENQRFSLTTALDRRLALGIDATVQGADRVGGLLTLLLKDRSLRRELVTNANAEFDGGGADRVAAELEEDLGPNR